MRHEPRKIAPCVGVTDMGLFNLIYYRDCNKKRFNVLKVPVQFSVKNYVL